MTDYVVAIMIPVYTTEVCADSFEDAAKEALDINLSNYEYDGSTVRVTNVNTNESKDIFIE